jgi:hypothetical protein
MPLLGLGGTAGPADALMGLFGHNSGVGIRCARAGNRRPAAGGQSGPRNESGRHFPFSARRLRPVRRLIVSCTPSGGVACERCPSLARRKNACPITIRWEQHFLE